MTDDNPHGDNHSLFGNHELPESSKPDPDPGTKPGISYVPISTVRLWEGNPRSVIPFDHKRDAELLHAIKSHGQKVPCIVRMIEGTPQLVVGCRRYGCVAHLAIADPTITLLIETRPMSDEDAVILVESENAGRKDITAYQRALSQEWALETVFSGEQKRLAQSLNISETTLSRSLALVRLPGEIYAIISDRDGLTPNAVARLSPKLNDATTRSLIVDHAVELGEGERTYPAAKALSLIEEALAPQTTVAPEVIEHRATGQRATITAGPKNLVTVKMPMDRMDKKAQIKFLKDVFKAIPVFVERMAEMDRRDCETG